MIRVSTVIVLLAVFLIGFSCYLALRIGICASSVFLIVGLVVGVFGLLAKEDGL